MPFTYSILLCSDVYLTILSGYSSDRYTNVVTYLVEDEVISAVFYMRGMDHHGLHVTNNFPTNYFWHH